MTALHMLFMIFAGNTSQFHCINKSELGAKIYGKETDIAKACDRYRANKCDTFVFVSDWTSLPEEVIIPFKNAFLDLIN